MRFKQSMRVGLLLALAVPAVGLTAHDSPAEAPSPMPAQAAAPAFGASNSKPATPRTYPCAKKVKEAFRDGRGVEHREAAADRAKVTTFDDSAGTRWTEVMPPAGFDPLQATDEQLEAFGFEARPQAGPQRTSWEKSFANYRGVEETEAPAERCQKDKLSFGIDYSANWTGGVTNGNSDYRRTSALVRWPQFFSDCGANSDNITGIWVGLGGVGPAKDLLQVGAYTKPTSLNDGQAFWEAINGGTVDSGARPMTLTISNQDLLRPDVYYNSANGQVTFAIYNQTTGFSAPSVTAGTISNYPVSSFYDGSTAEIIHERPSGGLYDGGFYGLRRWQGSGAGVTDASATRAGQTANWYGNYPHYTYNLTHNGASTSSTGRLLGYMNDGGAYTTSASWSELWYACRG